MSGQVVFNRNNQQKLAKFFRMGKKDTAEAKKSKQKEDKKSKGKENKIVELEKKMEELEQEISEAKDKYLRLFAEFDNYKKRTIKEKLEQMRTASQDLLQALLPVLDDFDRAKKSADDENSTEVFSDGVSLVYNKLNNVLKAKGLKAMETENQDFDPELHAALSEIPAPSEEMKGKIIDTIEKGYYLNDKIIRHAKVVVGK